MPDLDSIRQYRQESLRREARIKLKALMEDKIMLGQVRSLLAPSDTSAYPPNVLSTPVQSENLWNVTKLGQFDTNQKLIQLNKYANLNADGGVYRTLLHEAGHARGNSQYLNKYRTIMGSDSSMARNILLSEPYAETLADSIIKGYR